MRSEGNEATDTPSLDVRVEQVDAGWVVVGEVDGKSQQFGDAHPDREKAELYATHMFSAADRWKDAAEVDRPRPESYPNDGDPSRP